MNKKIKRVIALALTISAFSTFSSFVPGRVSNLVAKPVYAASYKPSNGELTSLKIKSTNGDTLDLKDGYNGDTVKLSDDKEYYVKLTDDSEGIKINAEAKGDDRVVRIFLSDDNDATAYKSGDKLIIGKGNTDIYVRTYESLNDFRNAKDKKNDVSICEEEYVIKVKKIKASKYEDDSQDPIYLSNIKLSKGDITFSKQRTSYNIKVAESVDEIKITAEPEDSSDRVRINGSLVDSSDNYRKTIDLKKGKNEIKVKVIDSKDNQRIYTLNVTRGDSSDTEQDDIYLSNLEVSQGDLDFSEDKTSYTLNVDNDVSKITVTAEPSDDEYLVTINGDEVTSGDDYKKKVSLKEGKNTIPVVIEDEVNDKKRTYTLTVNRKESEKSNATEVENNDKNNSNSNSNGAGWIQTDKGWQYKNESGEIVKNQWLFDKSANVYCYLNENGYRKTGWFKDKDGKWYLLADNGAMLTGWQKDGDKYYYMDTTSGAMQTGWLKIEQEDTAASTDSNSQGTDSGIKDTSKNKKVTWYYLNPGGDMATGWLQYGDSWYYLNSDGSMATGWIIDSGSKYYLNEDGSMQTEDKTIDGKLYKFNKSGAVII